MPALPVLAASALAAPLLQALGEGYRQAGRQLLLIPAIGVATLVVLVLLGATGKRHGRRGLACTGGVLLAALWLLPQTGADAAGLLGRLLP